MRLHKSQVYTAAIAAAAAAFILIGRHVLLLHYKINVVYTHTGTAGNE